MTDAAMALSGHSERVGSPVTLALVVLVLTGALVTSAGPVEAQPVHPATAASSPSESGIGWHELSAQQKDFLRPLERDWKGIDALQKRKWLELSGRMPKMSADERARVQTRMTDWAKLTPEQRGQARLRYQAARQVPPGDRQARWDAYQSLPTERKQQLAERATNEAAASAAARRAAVARERTARDPSQAKSNLGPPPSYTGAPRPVAPTQVLGRPGATTTAITRPPAPPQHQQPGLPKIAATPEFVNKATLLPRLGPQAAVPRPTPTASAPGAPLPRP